MKLSVPRQWATKVGVIIPPPAYVTAELVVTNYVNRFGTSVSPEKLHDALNLPQHCGLGIALLAALFAKR